MGTDCEAPFLGCVTLALDFDGVIVLPSGGRGARWDEYLERDLGISPRDLESAFFARYWAAVVKGELDLHQTLSRALDDLGSDLPEKVLSRYWFEHSSSVDVAVRRLLLDWRLRTGCEVLAVTNQERYRLNFMWYELGLGRVFDRVYWSGEIGLAKDDWRFYEYVRRAESLRPDALLMLDDTAENVELARRCGWRAAVVGSVEDIASELKMRTAV